MSIVSRVPSKLVMLSVEVNTLRPRQNGCHFTNDIFKCIFLYEHACFRLIFRWSLFLRFKLTILKYWFRYWPGDDQVTSHYLNQWCLVYWRIYASLGLNESLNWSAIIKPPYRLLTINDQKLFLWLKFDFCELAHWHLRALNGIFENKFSS